MKTWMISGCSTGFGRELTKFVLENGDQVVVTARNLNDIQDLVQIAPERAIAVQLDVTKQTEITSSVKSAIQKFGRIDVLVNNAGIGYFGAIEESEEAEVRRMFEINVFGLGLLTQEVLPHMRKQKSGHIINIASIAGIVGFPSIGYYNATKFAVVGLSEALAKETEHLGIKVTVICPSGFRTDWAGRSANDSSIKIDDYSESAWKNQENIRNMSGKQIGDPVRASQAMYDCVYQENPPLWLMLGKAAYLLAEEKTTAFQQSIQENAEVSIGADYPKQMD